MYIAFFFGDFVLRLFDESRSPCTTLSHASNRRRADDDDGQAMTSSKREANGKVVEMVLKPVKASA
jgi:hypothetical protein